MKRGTIFDIKELGLYDGDGIRLTVFLKGCPLSCVWCQNPEGPKMPPEVFRHQSRCKGCGRCKLPCHHPDCAPFGICLHACPDHLVGLYGKVYTADELAEEINGYGDFLAYGGVTFSGGEPALQSEFLCEVARQIPFPKAMETCAAVPTEDFLPLALLMDDLFVDLKMMDEGEHIRYTGRSNRQILENIRALDAAKKPFVIRLPLIPGITDSDENQAAIADFLSEMSSLQRVELLSYNPFTPTKYALIGRAYDAPIANRPPNIRTDLFAERGIPAVALRLRGADAPHSSPSNH
ncbi:MAG: glycyl-radical enzyme activating protein [Clostridia bacterium]|nr:glycyl-radical enzyme activating protein [Clostridia bacterium]